MKDRVFIENLTVFAQIGVYEWEQTIRQKLLFDLEMAWDCALAAKTDDVQACLNYAEVSQCVIDYVQSKPFLLVERVAYEVADLLQQRFQLEELRLKVSKPNAVAQASSVGVIIQRGQM